jgi:hypothetical protein
LRRGSRSLRSAATPCSPICRSRTIAGIESV